MDFVETQHTNTEMAVFGGGCFWCTEAVFKMLKGIISVMPGYAGGTKADPTYEDVCDGRTGHAEVIRITYDPTSISFTDLLSVFFSTHDPTTKNRQGNDIGPQYRSIILYTTREQKQEAGQFIKELNESHSDGGAIVTEVKELTHFYEAENYHRDYYAKNPQNSYCELVINSKLEKAQKRFAQLLKDIP